MSHTITFIVILIVCGMRHLHVCGFLRFSSRNWLTQTYLRYPLNRISLLCNGQLHRRILMRDRCNAGHIFWDLHDIGVKLVEWKFQSWIDNCSNETDIFHTLSIILYNLVNFFSKVKSLKILFFIEKIPFENLCYFHSI